MADKLTKKELKEPDAFIKVGAQARDWLQERQKLVAGIAIAIVVGGAGAALANYVSNRGEENASKELGEKLKVLSRPVVTPETQSTPVPGEEPPFKSEKEKYEALKKEMEAFRSKHAGTRAAVTATLSVAQAELKLGEYDRAIAGFKEFLGNVPKDDPMRTTALEGLGYALEAKKEYDQANAAFMDMAKENTSEFMTGMGMYHQARLLVLQGKKEEAAKVLTDLNTAHPGTAAARLASDRLTVLAAEGVKIPTPAPAAAPDAGQ